MAVRLGVPSMWQSKESQMLLWVHDECARNECVLRNEALTQNHRDLTSLTAAAAAAADLLLLVLLLLLVPVLLLPLASWPAVSDATATYREKQEAMSGRRQSAT